MGVAFAACCTTRPPQEWQDGQGHWHWHGGSEDFVEVNPCQKDLGDVGGRQQEFFVVLQKTNVAQPLGMDVDVGDRRTLLVEKVKVVGALPDWNRMHPEQAVLPGDQILAVNGTAGIAERMAVRCAGDLVLELRIQRGGIPRRTNDNCMGGWCEVGCLSGSGEGSVIS